MAWALPGVGGRGFPHEDFDAFEEDLVALAANMLGCSPIRTGALSGQVDRHLNEASGVAQICSEIFQLAVDSTEPGVETLLRGAEHLDWDRVIVVRLEELALPPFNFELL